jgi:hypothetical protein
VDPDWDEYGQGANGVPLYTGCMPGVAANFLTKYRATLYEVIADVSGAQADELGRRLWSALSSQMSGRLCSLTRAMLEVMGRVGLWEIPTARGQAASSTRKDKERRRATQDDVSPVHVVTGHCFNWSKKGECEKGSDSLWAKTHTPARRLSESAEATPFQKKKKGKRIRITEPASGEDTGGATSGGETDY